MDDGMDSRRNPGLDDEADGLDCFASEGVVIETADDAGALVETYPALPAARATPREILPDDGPDDGPGIAGRPYRGAGSLAAICILAWGRSDDSRCGALLGRPRRVMDDRRWHAARDDGRRGPRTQPRPARPIAQPVPEPPVARAVEPPRTAAPAATARTKAAVVPAPARRSSAPLETPSAAPAAPPKPSHDPLFRHRRLRPLSSWRRRRW